MRGHFNHDESMRRIAEEVKDSAYKIIEKKGSTYYGIGMAIKRICEAIIRDEESVLPVSIALHGDFGIDGVSLSVPAIVGKNGVEGIVPIELSTEEFAKLQDSANTLKKVLDEAFEE